MGPVYLKDLLTYYRPLKDGLRYDALSLAAPDTTYVTYGDRSFRAAAVKEWNKLPSDTRSAKTIESFKTKLKTHLFSQN